MAQVKKKARARLGLFCAVVSSFLIIVLLFIVLYGAFSRPYVKHSMF